ncbi:hypothetical protein ScPMuIL_013644 [Solemya velum]
MATVTAPSPRFEDDDTIRADQRISSSRKTPSLRSSAKFRRIPSECRPGSEKGSTYSDIEDQVLITEFGSRPDETLSESGSSESVENEDDENDIATTKEEEYDSDLEINFEEWVKQDRSATENSSVGEKYIEVCNTMGVIPVSYFLRHIEDHMFKMRFHGLGPIGAKALSVPLKTNRNIHLLDLEGNWIGSQGAIFLTNMLRDNIYITELCLAENKIGTAGAMEIADMLLKNDVLISVDLSGNGIDDDGAIAICNMLQRNTSIKHLYVRNNLFGEQSAVCFKEMLCQNETLETLDLSWNRFRTQGAVAISEGIQENVGLHTLNVAMNGFSVDGAKAMGKALKVNRTLANLNLSHNRIPEQGAAHIAFGLITNDVLKTLLIGCNPLARDGPMALLTALSKNDTSALVELNLEKVPVTPEFHELQYQLESERIFKVTHGCSIRSQNEREPEDPLDAFKRDPMSKLKQYVAEAGYRLIDLFKDMDKDGSMSVSKDEFVKGIKTAGVKISIRQIDLLLERLDQDGNGEIEWSELLQGEEEYQEWKGEVMKEHTQFVQEMAEKKDNSIFEKILDHEQVTEQTDSEKT